MLRQNRFSVLTVVALHVVSIGMFVLLVLPRDYHAANQVFGVGLALTAYTLGVRHAFDADHLAAIDNTTRRLVQQGHPRAGSVGLFFSLGHSSVVFLMSVLVAVGAYVVKSLLSEGSAINTFLGTFGTTVSGTFLLLIGIANLVVLIGLWRVWRLANAGKLRGKDLEQHLEHKGFLARLLNPILKAVDKPWRMYPVGFLFGLGFDTATSVSLLVLAGAGASSDMPWWAVITLPLLFVAGMSLFDTADGLTMQRAYGWAFEQPLRKIYYNMTTTALSVTIALIIGGIELISVLHERLNLSDAFTTAVANLSLDYVGFGIVALFILMWASSVAYWKLHRFGDRPSLA